MRFIAAAPLPVLRAPQHHGGRGCRACLTLALLMLKWWNRGVHSNFRTGRRFLSDCFLITVITVMEAVNGIDGKELSSALC